MPSRCLLLVLASLVAQSLSPAEATFERSAFPAPPLGATFRPSVNPATLGGIQALCGRLGHDQPFGLSDLSSHALVLAMPVPGGLGPRLGLGLGTARRGSAALSESAVWIGMGLHLKRLRLGLARRWLWWQGAAGAGSRARGWRVGLELALSDAWIIDGGAQNPTAVSPGRVDVRLRRRDRTGAVAGTVSARQGRRHIPAISLATHLVPRLILAGEVRSLAHSFGAGATLRGQINLHARVDTHPVLGRSYNGALTSSCNR